MKTKITIVLTLLAAGLSLSQAQSNVPREQCLKAAFSLAADLKQMLSTPIPTDPDLKRPVAVSEGDRGALVFPETKLTPETFAKVGKDIIPIGQLWLRKVTLQNEGQALQESKLQMVDVNAGQQAVRAALHALAVRKNAAGKLELLVYGSDKEPLFSTPLKEISAEQEDPIEISGAQQGDGALLTLKLVGKYEASVVVVSSE